MMSRPLHWFDHIWNAVGTSCARECCAMFVLRRDLSVLKHLQAGTRVLVGPSDLFGSHVPDPIIRDILLIMARNPRLRFRVLTRNAYRMEQWFGCWASSELQQMVEDWPLVNVELGVLIRDQDSADSYVGALVATPAQHRFIVVDRLKGEVDLEEMTCPAGVYSQDQMRACSICVGTEPPICQDGNYNALREGIDEVILAAPVLGPGHSDEPAWRGNIIGQCNKNNVSIFRPRPPNP
ncbi:MAG: DUF5131 family protein [Salinibacterium sp.]|nr:MAG: DUF5131 family protein [Salinibacterium sp.]